MTADLERPDASPRIAPLRGGHAETLSRRAWSAVALTTWALVSALIAVSAIVGVNNNHRISRLQNEGVRVSASVTSCLGQLGGSGSNGASYVCRVHYRFRGSPYDVVVAGLSGFARVGTREVVTIDPAQPGAPTLTSSLASESPSPWRYLVPTLLDVVWVGAGLVIIRRHRRLISSHL